MKKYLFTIAALLLIKGNIFAQACCTAGTPLLGSLEMGSANKGVWQFGLTYEYNSLQDVYAGSDVLDDQTRERISQAALLEINYGLTERISFTALISFIDQQRNIDPVSGFVNELGARGVGDALVMIKYNLLNLDMINQRELAVGAGVKAPFGRSDLKSNSILIPADMQPGTGSWDGVLWAYFSQGFLPTVPLNLFVNTSYRINNTNDRFGSNNQGYKFGNEFITSVGLGYRTDTPFDFTLIGRFRNTSPDEFGNEDISNTGGNWFYVVPGVNIKLFDGFTSRLSGQIPIIRDVQGTQLTTTFTTAISFFYSFGGATSSLLDF